MTDILNTYQIIKSQDQLIIIKMVQDVSAPCNVLFFPRLKSNCLSPGLTMIKLPSPQEGQICQMPHSEE